MNRAKAMMVSISVVVVAGVFSGAACVVEFGPQPLACQVVTPPAVPPGACVWRLINQQVRDTLLVNGDGFESSTPTTYLCGFIQGVIGNPGGCDLPNPFLIPTVPAPGSIPSGPECIYSDPS